MQVYFHAHNGTVVYITPPIPPRTKRAQPPIGPPGPLCSGNASSGTCQATAIRPTHPPPPPPAPPAPPGPPAPAPEGMKWDCHAGFSAHIAGLKDEDLSSPPFGAAASALLCVAAPARNHTSAIPLRRSAVPPLPLLSPLLLLSLLPLSPVLSRYFLSACLPILLLRGWTLQRPATPCNALPC